ncbi:hypothetical protein N1851_022409 [Merluccius polli]|uniref:Uncharacterized protein n=1 Tax=Merluccius polli TaxID=89951 RepID=A0AA47MHW0_MERPO|nr:hypothetical protein N1851_022409 [Merluccius polli]
MVNPLFGLGYPCHMFQGPVFEALQQYTSGLSVKKPSRTRAPERVRLVTSTCTEQASGQAVLFEPSDAGLPCGLACFSLSCSEADKKVGPASVQLHSWEVLDQPLGAYLEINPVLVNRLRVVHLVQLLVSTQMSIVFHAPPRDAVTSVSHSPTSAALIHLASWCVPVIGHHDEVRCCPGSRTCPGSRSCPGSGIIRPRSSYWLGSLHVAAASVRCWVPASGSPSLVVVFDTVLLQCTGSNPRRCRAGTGPERHRVGVVEGHQEEVVRAKVTPGIIGHYVEHLTHRQGPGET